jgi:hypothetical protein
VDTTLQFLRPGIGEPRFVAAGDGSEGPEDPSHTEGRRVAIANARGRPSDLEGDGFCLIERATAKRDFFDGSWDGYDDELVEAIGAVSGCDRVVVFDHTLRASDDSARRLDGTARQAVPLVHNDYTPSSGRVRARDLLPADVWDAAPRRFCILNAWRPLATVQQLPLAMCDASSVAGDDLIAVKRYAPGRIGEIQLVQFHPGQRWHYFPEMTSGELLVFRTFDSDETSTRRFTPHTAFVDPSASPSAPPRESVEARAFALWF